jgi:hypothetical protein
MSSWVAHVKSVQAKEGISYKAAMTKAKDSYKKPEKTEKKETKMPEAGEAKAPVKRKSKKEEPKHDMPEVVVKAEAKEKLVVKHENGKRVSSAEAKGKKKKGLLMQ